MYNCSCGQIIDKGKFPNHKQSIRHQNFKRKNKAKHHPFFIKEDETKEEPIILKIKLINYFTQIF